MRLALKLHPDSHCLAAAGIEVDVARQGASRLLLSYFVNGKTSALRLPPPAEPARADALWRHTCFEAFVRVPRKDPYYEFNFAPSRQWAAYGFGGYRSGMRVASEPGSPLIESRWNDTRYELQVSLDLGRLAELPGDAPWQLGLSAVIEETSGNKSYWALAHPPGKPDFHHSDCFAAALPAA